MLTTFSWDDRNVRRVFIRKVRGKSLQPQPSPVKAGNQLGARDLAPMALLASPGSVGSRESARRPWAASRCRFMPS